ncbi:MAG: riboflavin synthase [Bdellovibrionales bacterium]|nr:riboflavin synthase [Bdellovibrionales bacterium]
MFAGIIEESAKVVELTPVGDGAKLVLQSSLDHSETRIGDSIAVDGVCLTVIEKTDAKLTFDLAAETLRRSTLGALSAGSTVNLERSLVLGSRVHGHFVFGHVDTTAEIMNKSPEGNSIKLTLKLRDIEYIDSIVSKGSVSVSGVSLTVGEVFSDSFTVYIIPHTEEVTTLLSKQIGDNFNIEIDMLARYVMAQLSAGSVNLKASGMN